MKSTNLIFIPKRKEWFPGAMDCPDEMKCSAGHICAHVSGTHCDYSCLDTCSCGESQGIIRASSGGFLCICPDENAEIDCLDARKHLFPTATECKDEMKCQENQICGGLEQNSCSHYCVPECPCDIIFPNGTGKFHNFLMFNEQTKKII